MSNEQQPRSTPSEALLPVVDVGLRLGPGIESIALHLPSAEQVLGLLGQFTHDSLASAVPKRRAEFAAGRYAAGLALARFGCFEPILRAPGGAPLWPAGFRGSISHADSLVMATVARSETCRSLGVDIEQIVAPELSAELAPRVLSAADQEILRRALPHVSEAVRFSLGFSAKESLYKAINPLSGEFFDFNDASLVRAVLDTPHSGLIELALTRSLAGGFPVGYTAFGPFVIGARRVETGIVVT